MTGAAVALNGLITLLILIFPGLDGGALSSVMLAGAICYWLGAAQIGARRERSLTLGDRLYMGLGQISLVGIFVAAFLALAK